MKKIAIILFVLLIIALVAGCGGGGDSSTINNTPTTASLVGTWIPTDSADNSAIVFLTTSRYVVISPNAASDANTGYEVGDFTLNGTTGVFTPSILLNNDSNNGFSNVSGNITLSMIADNLAVKSGNTTRTYSKQQPDPSSAIVGTWYLNSADTFPGLTSQTVFVALANGNFYSCKYSTASEIPELEALALGVEYGTYTWDPTTPSFSFNTTVDNNGLNGFSNIPEGYTLTVSGDTLTLSADGELPTMMHRIGN